MLKSYPLSGQIQNYINLFLGIHPLAMPHLKKPKKQQLPSSSGELGGRRLSALIWV